MVDAKKWIQARGYWVLYKDGGITLAEFWDHIHYLNHGTFKRGAAA